MTPRIPSPLAHCSRFRLSVFIAAACGMLWFGTPSDVRAASWVRIADFDDGTFGGMTVFGQGTDNNVTIENGSAVVQPLTNTFDGGIDVKRRFAKKALGIRTAMTTRNCDNTGNYSFEIAARVGVFANSTDYRAVASSFQRNSDSIANGIARVNTAAGRQGDSGYTQEAYAITTRPYTEGNRVKITLMFDRAKEAFMSGNKIPTVLSVLRKQTPDPLERSDQLVQLQFQTSAPGNCQFLIEYVEVLLP